MNIKSKYWSSSKIQVKRQPQELNYVASTSVEKVPIETKRHF
uniref:Uncharacterized protein n=1 Tax=Rhizophora mucronata TaxID=61149 RepID=A0A2P2PWQ0_RHIMU